MYKILGENKQQHRTNNNNKMEIEMNSELELIKNENGAYTLPTTSSKRLDLFFQSVRNINKEMLLQYVQDSWREDALDTLKILFYIRDCRGGKGERDVFYVGMKWVAENHTESFLKNLALVPFYGRWGDLLHFFQCEKVAKEVAALFAKQLKQDLEQMALDKPVSLCAKWAPTEGCHFDKKGMSSVKLICEALGLGSKGKKAYRKEYLTPLRANINVVETLMCSKQWSSIDYSKVPGEAMNKLKKAFQRNDQERFKEYQEKLASGSKEVKVNATTVEPHVLCRSYMHDQPLDTIIEEQWKVIVERVRKLGSMAHSLVLSDVSSSMKGTPMEVSIALGLLISELSLPPFTNKVLTFETNPILCDTTAPTLRERVNLLRAAPWGGSTNLQKAFDLILETAVRTNLRPEDMPTRIFIISDMQFDCADSSYKTSHQLIKEKYVRYGYALPQIVYWNVRAATGFTAGMNEQGVALLSGFSPSVLKSVIDGKDFTPYSIMRMAIDDMRYKAIQL
jgi:hypothetical protein